MAKTKAKATSERKIKCENCPLIQLKVFRDFTPDEFKFVNSFKTGELAVKAGSTLLLEGNNSAHLYTLLSGWIFRYKLLPDGRRQILNFALPGDFIGLQASVFNEMQHTVEALTDVVLCVFPREKLWSLYSTQPGLGFDVTWLAAREEKMLDDHLLSVGRRTAIERLAFLILHIFRRAKEVKLTQGNSVLLPINQQHVADTLGMSLVHTNKTLRKLYDRKLVEWREKSITILDEAALIRIARFEGERATPRPLI
jgi:CRP/FNR family transcriptional regulator, anaerobic regulatory protein